MEHYESKEFATKKELFRFLAENRDRLIAQKKAVIKKEDCGVIVNPTIVIKNNSTNKANTNIDPSNLANLKVVCIINTTNFLDSHMDVHLPGIWNKSLSDNKNIMHLQEHDMQFDKIISDGKNLKSYAKKYNWTELGYSYPGETEVLVFESDILKSRNPFMLSQYANGWVKNHSVGMYYVKTDMAINDEEYPNYFEAWKKYYPQIVNPQMADERGYFYYVLEAKCVEGSAVPLGSNTATPTLQVGKSIVICPSCGNEFAYEMEPETGMGYVNCPNCGNQVTQDCNKPEKNEPSHGTHNIPEPSKDTREMYNYLLMNLKS